MIRLITIISLVVSMNVNAKSIFECSLANPSPKVLEADQLTSKTPVFVYYANDFAINPGYDWGYRNFLRLQSHLESAALTPSLSEEDKTYLSKVAALMQADLRLFAEATAKQAHQVESIGCGDKNNFNISSVVITNQSVPSPHAIASGYTTSKIRIQYCRSNSTGDGYERGVATQDVVLPREVSTDPVALDYFTQPLLMPSVLKDSITALRKIYDPDNTQFILWMKSYGDEKNVFRPPYQVDAAKIESSKLWQALLTQKVSDIEKAELVALSGQVRVLSAKIRDIIDREFADTSHRPTSANEIRFLEKEVILQQVLNISFSSRQTFTSFPYIIWDADKSALGLSPNPNIKAVLSEGGSEQMQLANVGKVCTLQESPLNYETVDFTKLFLPFAVDRSKGFMAHLSKVLE